MTGDIRTHHSGHVNIVATPPEKIETGNTVLFNKTHISQAKALSLYSESQKATEAMLAVLSDKTPRSSSALLVNNGAPELREPRAFAGADTKLNSNAMFTKLAGNALILLGNVSLEQLANRLAIILANSAAVTQFNEVLAAQFQQAVAANTAAMGTANTDAELLQTAQNLAEVKQQIYDQAKSQLSQLSPEDPEHAAALGRFESAEQELAEAAGQLDKAQVQANASYQAARDTALVVDELFNKLQGLANASAPVIEQQEKQSLNAIARMLLLIGTFIKLVGKNSEKALENDSALFQRIQESRQQEMQRKSDEYTAEVRKAEVLNKAMGCVGKILGGLITALSIVGAVFSGGASLVFAAVGLALMVGDAIGKAATGVSFMEKALSPLMENIIKPLVDALSKGIAKMLERLGVDAATANMVGGIVGTLVAAALIIAVVVVGKAAAGKVASTAFANMVNEAIKKLIPNILKNVAAKSSTTISNGVKRLLEKLTLPSDKAALANYTNRLNTINVSVGLGSETAQAGGRIARGMYEKNAQDILASFTLSAAVMDQMRHLLELMVEKFGESQSSMQRQWADLIAAQTHAAETHKTIIRNSFA